MTRKWPLGASRRKLTITYDLAQQSAGTSPATICADVQADNVLADEQQRKGRGNAQASVQRSRNKNRTKEVPTRNHGIRYESSRAGRQEESVSERLSV